MIIILLLRIINIPTASPTINRGVRYQKEYRTPRTYVQCVFIVVSILLCLAPQLGSFSIKVGGRKLKFVFLYTDFHTVGVKFPIIGVVGIFFFLFYRIRVIKIADSNWLLVAGFWQLAVCG